MRIAEEDVRNLTRAMGQPDIPFKSAPNWREAFEQALAAGGTSGNCGACSFCIKLGVKNVMETRKCVECPFFCEGDVQGGAPCWDVFCDSMDNSDRRVICRYALQVGGDFIDRDEARLLIGTALTILGKDDAREKFLGKAEPATKYAAFPKFSKLPFVADGYSTTLNHLILDREKETLGDAILAAFRDEETRDLALKFLNAEASEKDEVRRLLNQLKSLWATL